MKSAIAWGACLLVFFACGTTWAQTATVSQEYDKLIKSRTNIEALGTDLFGDRIDTYTGALEFVQTDVSIPGSNALDVSIGRRFVLPRERSDLAPGMFGDWDLEIPHIHGVFSRDEGWTVNSTTPMNRCSKYAAPLDIVTTDRYGIFSPSEYWHGTFLYMPGAGDQEVLKYQSGPRPATGTYPLTTKSGMAIGCTTSLAATSEGTGEGFVVVTPQGITYRFDHMASRFYKSLKKPAEAPPAAAGGEAEATLAPVSYVLARREYWLMPTSATDRFGNTVSYEWSATNPWQLKRILSSDGRQITLGYGSDTAVAIHAVTASNRTWTYSYTSSSLTQVLLPGNSTWQFDLGGMRWAGLVNGAGCGTPGTSTSVMDGSMVHPSGATGAFAVRPVVRGMSWSPPQCMYAGSEWEYDDYPAQYIVPAIQSKRISGNGLPALGLTWSYAYGPHNGCYSLTNPWGLPVCSASSPTTATTTVTDPSNTASVFTFGNRYKNNQGQLLRVDVGPAGSAAQRTTSTTYAATTDGMYPSTAGYGIRPRGDGEMESRNHPIRQVSTSQDGEVFTWKVNTGCNGKPYCFDILARPTSITRTNTLSGNPSRTEVTTYHDDNTVWVLGQVANVTCIVSTSASTACDGDVVSQTDYGWKALPRKTYNFGKPQQYFTYDSTSTVASGQLGTLNSITDGRGSVTTLTQWKRGVPGKITHPATTDQPTAVSQSATINDDGTIATVTDENGYKTCYDYDAMGRLAGITYPSETQLGVCDTSRWAETTLSFKPGYPAALGLPAGHWRQLVQTGQGRKTILFDALWRPVVEQTLDLTDIDNTKSEVAKRYDATGRLAFQSYPMQTVGNFTDPALKGTKYTYDALDRPLTVVQDSELGPLTTQTQYTSPFRTLVTNPRGKVTDTLYLAYDQPTYDWPRQIVHPGDAETAHVNVYISRDPFGKPLGIKRTSATGSPAITRTYTYNANQELCRVDEPETGITAMGYDAAGNLAWSASGYGTTAAGCPTSASVAARRIDRTYDARNRLLHIYHPDGRGNIAYSYTPDGLVDRLETNNDASGTQQTISTYVFNRRRLVTRETLQPLGGTTAWAVGYAYNGNGHRSLIEYPTGLDVALAPDALGRPTAAGTFASGATYAPNGALASFTYGNTILHQLTQNARGLPDRSLDIYGSTHYLDDGYDYDQNGNVLAISDGRNATHRRNVDMHYDGLDRLTQATSKMFGTTGALATITYAYDVLDNLTRVTVPATATALARDHYYCYNAKWQLAFVRTGPTCTGSTPSPSVLALEYDPQGNVTHKDAQAFDFDFGNRLRSSPGMSYVYDGWGRRVLSCTTSVCTYSFYSREGPLLFTWDERTGRKTEHIYFGGSLVAERSAPLAGGTVDVRYQHTDALGSPVVVTDQARNVIAAENAEYEPYGRLANRAPTNGPGYTGHVEDAATGLVYMQQRYYDPMIGRFLSVDPVALDSITGSNFNRYWYANNNPYRFTDPDGRESASFYTDSQYRMAAPSFDGVISAVSDFFNSPAGQEMVYNAGVLIYAAGTARGNLGQMTRDTEVAASALQSARATTMGRIGRQERLREIANDPKASSADRGWIRNEQRQIAQGNRTSIRNPPGKELAHERGREAAKGYSYRHSNLQDKDLHRTQHKFDDYGRKNRERPLQ